MLPRILKLLCLDVLVTLPLAGCAGSAGEPIAASPHESGAAEIVTREEKFEGLETVRCRSQAYLDAQRGEVLHGAYAVWHENSQKHVEGTWTHGKRTGVWNAWHPNGKNWVSARFSAGQPIGTWIYYDEQGREQGKRVEGKKHGPWREWSAGRNCWGEGVYVDGKLHGRWVFKDARDQPLCELTFDQGEVHGRAVIHKSLVMEYEFDHGQEMPLQRKTMRGEKSFTGDDARYGPVVRAAASPSIENVRWIPEAVSFDPPTTYQHRELWPNGKPRYEASFRISTDAGRVVPLFEGRSARWYENGQLEMEQMYAEGLAHGPFSAWYGNGRRRYTLEFSHGNPTGHWKFWYESGVKKAEGDLTTENRTGDWVFWKSSGDIAKVANVQEWLNRELDLAQAR